MKVAPLLLATIKASDNWVTCPADIAQCSNELGFVKVTHKPISHRCFKDETGCRCVCEAGEAFDGATEDAQGIPIVTIQNSDFATRPRYVDDRTITVDGVEYSPFQFAKTLTHDPVTYMPTEADASVLRAAAAFDAAEGAILAVRQCPSTTRKIEGLYSGHHKRLRSGSPLGTLSAPNYHRADSVEGLCDIVENYWANIMAETPFENYGGSSAAVAAASELQKCGSAYKGPTPTQSNLFRGTFPGEEDGPYLSQMLMRPYSWGGVPSENKVTHYHLLPTSAESWLKVQNGEVPSSLHIEEEPSYVYNVETLGAMVHKDALYQYPYAGALVALQSGVKLSNQLPEVTVSSAWKEFGGPDLLGHIASVADGALRHSWVTKFHDHMKIRPEVMSMRMAQLTDSAYNSDVKAELTRIIDPSFLEKMSEFGPTRSYLEQKAMARDPESITPSETSSGFPLLQSLYPEMSPTHPAFPAGHSVVAGACVTIMKAMFVTHDADKNPLPWPATGQVSLDGKTLSDVPSADQNVMTIIGELNKLAQNIEMGRMMAQVHYRSDGNGILLGEEFAISYLVDNLGDYGSQFLKDKYPNTPADQLSPELMLQKYDGSFVKITSFGVTAV